MKNEKSTPETRALNSENPFDKCSEYIQNNQLIDELDRKIAELETFKVKKVKKLSLFDVVTAVGLTVLIIQLILQW